MQTENRNLWKNCQSIFLFSAAMKPDEEKAILNKHNMYRELHGCPPLTLVESYSKDCMEYAKELAAIETLKKSSDADIKYGENLCLRSQEPTLCVRDWYDQCENYDYDDPNLSELTSHFTALIWKNARELGFGHARGKNGRYWVVARYYPPVNIKGEFKENVPKRIKQLITRKIMGVMAVLNFNKEIKTPLIGLELIPFSSFLPCA
ncbi:Golgi-associated plant pathogenesis-related protein 1 isoform X2 [Drosophila takahashii]|uniref:Golgi-associated plant pathogenesis-related protein 1 isoform X2 n=1 Tax=Drosophila takahashii TaxID=29030 RepID=UPI003898DF4D